jgi:hypothetical protein
VILSSVHTTYTTFCSYNTISERKQFKRKWQLVILMENISMNWDKVVEIGREYFNEYSFFSSYKIDQKVIHIYI